MLSRTGQAWAVGLILYTTPCSCLRDSGADFMEAFSTIWWEIHRRHGHKTSRRTHLDDAQDGLFTAYRSAISLIHISIFSPFTAR